MSRWVHRGIAYLNWIDTDMIRDADRYPVLRGHMPPPARRTFPPDQVAARLVRAVERCRTAVSVPGRLRLAQVRAYGAGVGGRAVVAP